MANEETFLDRAQERIDVSSSHVFSTLEQFVREMRDMVDGAAAAEREACIATLQALIWTTSDPQAVDALLTAVRMLRLRDQEQYPESVVVWRAPDPDIMQIMSTLLSREDGMLDDISKVVFGDDNG